MYSWIPKDPREHQKLSRLRAMGVISDIGVDARGGGTAIKKAEPFAFAHFDEPHHKVMVGSLGGDNWKGVDVGDWDALVRLHHGKPAEVFGVAGRPPLDDSCGCGGGLTQAQREEKALAAFGAETFERALSGYVASTRVGWSPEEYRRQGFPEQAMKQEAIEAGRTRRLGRAMKEQLACAFIEGVPLDVSMIKLMTKRVATLADEAKRLGTYASFSESYQDLRDETALLKALMMTGQFGRELDGALRSEAEDAFARLGQLPR